MGRGEYVLGALGVDREQSTLTVELEYSSGMPRIFDGGPGDVTLIQETISKKDFRMNMSCIKSCSSGQGFLESLTHSKYFAMCLHV